MKKWIIILLGALAAAGLIAYLMGRRLPRDHVAAVRAHYHQPPDSVYAAIADVGAYPKWRADVKRVTVLPQRNGREVWREVYGRDSLEFERTVAFAPTRMVVTMTTLNAGFSGRWMYQTFSDSTGTTLTITEEGAVDNAFFRFMMRYVLSPYTTLEKFERALGARFGETVVTARVS